MGAARGIGATLAKGVTSIGVLTSIKAPEKSADTVETTTLDSSDGFKTFLQGMRDGGEMTASGYFDVSDTGQIAMNTAIEAGTVDAYTITYPAGMGSPTFTFNGIVTKFVVGEANLEDAVTFEVTLKISGKPSLNTSASTGLSNLSLTGAGGTLVPSFGATLRSYVFSGVSATSVTVTPTAGSHTIKLYIDGVYTETVTSGAASSSIALTINVSKKLTLVCYEAGKTAINYDIIVIKTS
jgi:predicted secreted protein